MKPLPTLTKPLRSVDIDDAAARRRRCASAPTPDGAGGGRRGRGDGRVRAGRGLPGEVRRRPRRRRVAAVDAPRADRLAQPAAGRPHGARLRRVHGRGQALARCDRGARHRRARRDALGKQHRRVLRRGRRGRVPPARGADRPRALAGRAAIALGGGSVLSETVRAALRTTPSSGSGHRRRDRLGARRGRDRPLAADREGVQALHAERRPLYAGGRRRVPPRATGSCAARSPRCGRSPTRRPARSSSGRAAGGREYPVFVGRGLVGGLPRPGGARSS